MIAKELLVDFGAEQLTYPKDTYIFKEGDKARFYYQVITGEVKMNNYNKEGKEFIQSLFAAGNSFGEPPLFADFAYPANAKTLKRTTVFRVQKARFLELLTAHPKVHLKLTAALSSRLYYKAIMATELSFEEAGHRILRFLDYMKNEVYGFKAPFAFEVNLTRQQIADLTGLRVETVIRTVKKLSVQGELQLKGRKIFR